MTPALETPGGSCPESGQIVVGVLRYYIGRRR